MCTTNPRRGRAKPEVATMMKPSSSPPPPEVKAGAVSVLDSACVQALDQDDPYAISGVSTDLASSASAGNGASPLVRRRQSAARPTIAGCHCQFLARWAGCQGGRQGKVLGMSGPGWRAPISKASASSYGSSRRRGMARPRSCHSRPAAHTSHASSASLNPTKDFDPGERYWFAMGDQDLFYPELRYGRRHARLGPVG